MSQSDLVDEVQSFILATINETNPSSNSDPLTVMSPSFDLLLEGMIDSLGLVEIVNRIELQYGIEFDFDQLDIDDLTRIGPLSTYVAGLVEAKSR